MGSEEKGGKCSLMKMANQKLLSQDMADCERGLVGLGPLAQTRAAPCHPALYLTHPLPRRSPHIPECPFSIGGACPCCPGVGVFLVALQWAESAEGLLVPSACHRGWLRGFSPLGPLPLSSAKDPMSFSWGGCHQWAS